ncbi:MAG: adenylosuccinate synthetase, partial [Desulfohalobiaceae bacterium]|nr:adenylosuccinate synthetase [Desulfohalobiaceae bacterium]
LDLVLLGESARLNSPTGIALTKLDVLSGLPELKLCVAYNHGGEQVLYPPQKENGLAEVHPVYQTLPGWEEDISGVRSWNSLPKAARVYIERIEEVLGVGVSMVSVGPDREQTLFR